MAQYTELVTEGRAQSTAMADQSLEAILDRLVQNVGLLLEIPSCSVALLDKATGDLVTCAALDAGPEGLHRTRFRANEGMAGWVAAHLRPLVIDDVSQEPRFKQLGAGQEGSALCVPLLDDDKLLGTLTATSLHTGAFDARRQQLLQVFANQAVLAITKAQQAQAARAQANELAMLLDAARALTSSLDPREFFGQIVASIRRQVAECEDAVIYAYDEHTRVLRVVHGLGRRVERLGGKHIPLDDPQSIAAWVAQHKHPRKIDLGPFTAGAITEAFLAGDRMAVLSVPLVSKKRLRGVITLARLLEFNDAELRAMVDLANIVAAALENVELYQTAWAEREQLQAVFAAGSDGIAIVDAALTIRQANEAFARLVGLPPNQLVGKTCCVVLRQGGGQCGLCRGQNCMVSSSLESDNALPHVECQFQVPQQATQSASSSGEPRQRSRTSQPMLPAEAARYVDMSVTPVHGPQGRHALLIGRDITAERQMDLMKASFLSMVSHELRSPLHTINSHLDALLQGIAGPVSPEQHEFMRRARAGGERLNAMVDDVLLMSRRDVGEFHLNRELLRLDTVIAEAREEVEFMAFEADIKLTYQVPPGLPVIEGDDPRLRQVLRNLLNNAIKFTPRGGTVQLSAAYDENWVRLSVSDTGAGIAPEHHSRIFDRFYQVPTNDRHSRGQGLGLAIVRIIVEGHGGHVEVSSTPGHGSTFTFWLPRLTADRDGR
jgi:signal transduction histidine kinase/GAF domain-containing protein